jgi:hypothetical protein
MIALYLLQPFGNDLSQREQHRHVPGRHGGDDKPLAKAILGEVLLKPLKIGKHGALLLFVRYCSISQKIRGIDGACGPANYNRAARHAMRA